jgi:hypothetical protein
VSSNGGNQHLLLTGHCELLAGFPSGGHRRVGSFSRWPPDAARREEAKSRTKAGIHASLGFHSDAWFTGITARPQEGILNFS